MPLPGGVWSPEACASTIFMPMAEQKKLHDEIRTLKDEMDMLEKRTRRKG